MDNTINTLFEEKCLRAVKEEILDIIEGNPGRVFLFGSRARGNPRRGSDIDIGIEGMSDDLIRKIRIRMNLFWEESFVPYHLDIVDFNKVRESFRKVAMERITLWKKH